MQRHPPRRRAPRVVRWPECIEKIVAEHDCAAADKTGSPTQKLRTGEDDHAGTDCPEHLENNRYATQELHKPERWEYPGHREHGYLDQDEPQAALHQKD